MRGSAMGQRGKGRIRPVGVRDVREDEAAVTDVLGSLLLVGITVIMAVGLGLLLLNFDGPPDTQHTRMAVALSPALGGWSTGDEEIRIQHLGGEPLTAENARIAYELGGSTTTLDESTLGSAFADGQLTIGETWVRTVPLDLNDEVEVRVIEDHRSGSQLLASTTAVAGATVASALCVGDTTAPTLADLDRSPTNVNALTSILGPAGDVVVEALILDDCSGVSSSSPPVLRWCLGLASACTSPYTNAVTMVFDSNSGRWDATIPAQNWAAAALAGRTLWFQVHNMVDTAVPPNAGTGGIFSDLIELIGSAAYVDTIVSTPSTGIGTLTGNIADAQSDLTTGVYVVLNEGATTGTPGSGTATLEGTTGTAVGTITTPQNALTSNQQRAEAIDTGEGVEVKGFDLPSAATGVTNIVVHAELKKSAGGKDPVMQLQYRVGSSGGFTTESDPHTITVNSDDILISRNLQANVTTVADAELLEVRALMTGLSGSGSDRQLEVDRLWIVVTYSTAAPTVHRMDMQADLDGVGSGLTKTLEIVHTRTVDSYNVLVYNWIAATWRNCAVLNGAPAGVTCDISPLTHPNEVSASNQVRVRFTDVNTGNTSPGTLSLDYLRVTTV